MSSSYASDHAMWMARGYRGPIPPEPTAADVQRARKRGVILTGRTSPGPTSAEVQRQREAEARVPIGPIKPGAIRLGTPDATGGKWRQYYKGK